MLDGHIPLEDYRKMSEESWFLESDDASLALASVFSGKDGALRYPITLSDGTALKVSFRTRSSSEKMQKKSIRPEIRSG